MTELLKLKVKVDAKKAATDLKLLSNNIKGMGSVFNGANKNLNRLSGSFRNLNLDANRSNVALGKFGKTLGNINFAGAIYGVVQLAQGLGKAIQASMDSIETTNLFNVAMGEMAESSYEAVKAMSEATGLDQTNLMSAIGTYNLLARSMGFSSEQAAILSENTTKLALDLSSLANVPFEQALADLKSGLIGQTETVYKYGIDLTEATLQQEAMRLGIEDSVRTMTQGEKMALRYSAMIRQAGLAHGDFARTIDTPANQLRLLKENFVSLARAIGNVFMPVLQVIVPVIRGVVMALTELINAFATFLGFEPAKVENIETGFGGVSDSVSDTTDSVEELKKAAKDIAAPFDELNAVNLDTPSSGGGGAGGVDGGLGGGLSDEFGEALKEYDNLMSGISDKAKKIRDALFEWLGIIRSVNEETGEVSFSLAEGGFLDQVRDAIEAEDWFQVGELFAEKINEALSMFEQWFSWDNLGASIVGFLNTLTGIFNGFVTNLDWSTIGQIIANAIEIAAKSAITLLEGVDWSAFGTGLATMLSSAIENTPWDVVGVAISTALNSAFEFLYSFITTIDFAEAGRSIMEAVNMAIANTDWTLVGQTIIAGLTSAIEFVLGAILSIDISGVATAINELMQGAFTEFMNWLTEADPTIRNATVVVGAFFAAWTAVEIMSTLGMLMSGQGFAGLTGSLKNLVTQMIVAKTETLQLKLMYAGDFIKNIATAATNIAQMGVKWVVTTGQMVAAKAAQLAINAATLVWNATCAIATTVTTAFGAAVTFLTSPIGLVVIAITALIAIIVLLVKNWDTVKEKASEVWEKIKEIWNAASTWFDENVVTPIKDKFKAGFDKVKETVQTAWDNIKKVFNDVKTWVENNIVNPVKDAIKSLLNGIIGTFEKAVNFIIKEINKLHWKLPDWLGGKEFGFNFDPISIPRLARGGSLADGQLFQAGEFGKAELIGNYNGQTTVMPLENSGFVEAMYQAVYNAVTSANESGGGSVIENILTLDNEVIYRGQQKVQARKGVQLVSPTFSRG